MVTSEQIRSLLPYGDAFRFVDEVLALTAPREILTQTDFGRRPDILEAHFLNGPAMVPGVLIVEQVAQSALLLARLSDSSAAARRAVIGRISCSFERPALGAAIIRTHVKAEISSGLITAFRGTAFIRDEQIARIILVTKDL